MSKTEVKDLQSESDSIEVTEVEPDLFIRKSKKSKYIIEYHRDMCIGIGSCANIAPNTFVMDDENKAVLVKEVAEEDLDEMIIAAAESCPVLAIIIKDAETGEQVFPVE